MLYRLYPLRYIPNVDPHQPLRDDVRLLGSILGDTVRDAEGNHAFETVERYEEHDSGPDGSRTSSAIFVARP